MARRMIDARSYAIPDALTQGLYTVGEAAELCEANPSTVRNWALGTDQFRPVLKRGTTEAGLVSFLELMELKAVALLRKQKIPLQHIRQVKEVLMEKLRTPFPLAVSDLYALGRSIIIDERSESAIRATFRDVLKRQGILPSLRDGLQRIRVLWDGHYPSAVDLMKNIRLDPRIQFGKPIETEHGFRTSVIYSAYIANQRDSDFVASLFLLKQSTVKSVVAFEERNAA